MYLFVYHNISVYFIVIYIPSFHSQNNMDHARSSSSIPISQVHHFWMMYFEDPWILSSPSNSVEELKHEGMEKPLSIAEDAYQDTIDSSPTHLHMEEVNDILTPIWEVTILILHIVSRWYFPQMRLF